MVLSTGQKIGIGIGISLLSVAVIVMISLAFSDDTSTSESKTEENVATNTAGNTSSGNTAGNTSSGNTAGNTSSGNTAGNNTGGNESPDTINQGATNEPALVPDITSSNPVDNARSASAAPTVQTPVGINPILCSAGYLYDPVLKNCYMPCGPNDVMSSDKTRCIRKPTAGFTQDGEAYLKMTSQSPEIYIPPNCNGGINFGDNCYTKADFPTNITPYPGGTQAKAVGINSYTLDPVDPAKSIPVCDNKNVKFWAANIDGTYDGGTLSYDNVKKQCYWINNKGAKITNRWYNNLPGGISARNADVNVKAYGHFTRGGIPYHAAKCPPGYSLSYNDASPNALCDQKREYLPVPVPIGVSKVTSAKPNPLTNYTLADGKYYKNCAANSTFNTVTKLCERNAPSSILDSDVSSALYDSLAYIYDATKNAYKIPSYLISILDPKCPTNYTLNTTDKLCYVNTI